MDRELRNTFVAKSPTLLNPSGLGLVVISEMLLKNRKRRIFPDWVWKQDDTLYDRLEAIAALATQVDVPMSQYSLAWTLSQPAISSLIVGVKNSEQIKSAIAAVDFVIPAEHFPKLDAVCQPPWQFPDPVRGHS